MLRIAGFWKRIAILFSLFFVLSWAFPCLGANEAKIDIDEILNKVDRLYRSDYSRGKMEMHIETPNWERSMSMKVWSEGIDKTFITIDKPKKDRGISTLRVDNEMWNYFPKIDKVMKVPPSMMMGSWMGSDFTNDDLVKESTLINDYQAKIIKPDNAEAGLIYLEARPKKQTVSVWGRIVIVVRQGDYLPLRQEYYDEKDRKMRVMHFKDIRDLGGRTIPTTMEMIPTNKKGHKTTVRYLEIDFDVKLGKDVFSLRNLKKRR